MSSLPQQQPSQRAPPPQKRRQPPPRRGRPGSKRPRTIFNLDNITTVAPPEFAADPFPSGFFAVGDDLGSREMNDNNDKTTKPASRDNGFTTNRSLSNAGKPPFLGTYSKGLNGHEKATTTTREASTMAERKAVAIPRNKDQTKSLHQDDKIQSLVDHSEAPVAVREALTRAEANAGATKEASTMAEANALAIVNDKASNIETEIKSLLQNQQPRCDGQQRFQMSKSSGLHDFVIEPGSDLHINEACGFTQSQIHFLIAKQCGYRKAKNYGDADKIQDVLKQHGIFVSRRLKKYRVDGRRNFVPIHFAEVRRNEALIDPDDSVDDDGHDETSHKAPWWTKDENQHALEEWVMGNIGAMITTVEREEERSLMNIFDERIMMQNLLCNIEHAIEKNSPKTKTAGPKHPSDATDEDEVSEQAINEDSGTDRFAGEQFVGTNVSESKHAGPCAASATPMAMEFENENKNHDGVKAIQNSTRLISKNRNEILSLTSVTQEKENTRKKSLIATNNRDDSSSRGMIETAVPAAASTGEMKETNKRIIQRALPKWIINQPKNFSIAPFDRLFTPQDFDSCVIKPLRNKLPHHPFRIRLLENFPGDKNSYLLEARISNDQDNSDESIKRDWQRLRSTTEAYLQSKISRVNLRWLLEDGASLELDLILSFQETLGVSFSKFTLVMGGKVTNPDNQRDCLPGLWIKRVLPGKGLAKALGSHSHFRHGCALLTVDGTPIHDPLALQAILQNNRSNAQTNNPSKNMLSVRICLSKHSDLRAIPLTKLLKSFRLRRRDGKPLDPKSYPGLSGQAATEANANFRRNAATVASETESPPRSVVSVSHETPSPTAKRVLDPKSMGKCHRSLTAHMKRSRPTVLVRSEVHTITQSNTTAMTNSEKARVEKESVPPNPVTDNRHPTQKPCVSVHATSQSASVKERAEKKSLPPKPVNLQENIDIATQSNNTAILDSEKTSAENMSLPKPVSTNCQPTKNPRGKVPLTTPIKSVSVSNIEKKFADNKLLPKPVNGNRSAQKPREKVAVTTQSNNTAISNSEKACTKNKPLPKPVSNSRPPTQNSHEKVAATTPRNGASVSNSEKAFAEIEPLPKPVSDNRLAHSLRKKAAATNPSENAMVLNSEKAFTKNKPLSKPVSDNHSAQSLAATTSSKNLTVSNSEKAFAENKTLPKPVSDNHSAQSLCEIGAASNSSKKATVLNSEKACTKNKPLSKPVSDNHSAQSLAATTSSKNLTVSNSKNACAKKKPLPKPVSDNHSAQSLREKVAATTPSNNPIQARSRDYSVPGVPKGYVDPVEQRPRGYGDPVEQRPRGYSAPIQPHPRGYSSPSRGASTHLVQPQSKGYSSPSRGASTQPFEAVLNAGQPLGGYFRTEKGQNFKSRCVLLSKYAKGQLAYDTRIQVGTQFKAVLVGDRRIEIPNHLGLQTRYNNAKKYRRNLHLILQNSNSCMPEPDYISVDNWSSSGAWIGKVTNGWAGGASCEVNKPAVVMIVSNPREGLIGSPNGSKSGWDTKDSDEISVYLPDASSAKSLNPRAGSFSPTTIVDTEGQRPDTSALPGEEIFMNAIRNKSWEEVIYVLENGPNFSKQFVQQVLESQYHYVGIELKKMTRGISDQEIEEMEAKKEDLEAKKKILKLYISSVYLIEKTMALRNWTEVIIEIRSLQLFNPPLTAAPGRSKVISTMVRTKAPDTDLGHLPVEIAGSQISYTSGNNFTMHNNYVVSLENRKLVVDILEGDFKKDKLKPRKLGGFVLTLNEIEIQSPSKGHWTDIKKQSESFGILGLRAKRRSADREYVERKRLEILNMLNTQVETMERFNREYCHSKTFRLTSNVRGIQGISLLYAAVEIMAELPLVQNILSLGGDPGKQSGHDSHSKGTPLDLARKQYDRCRAKEDGFMQSESGFAPGIRQAGIRQAFAHKTDKARRLWKALEAAK